MTRRFRSLGKSGLKKRKIRFDGRIWPEARLNLKKKIASSQGDPKDITETVDLSMFKVCGHENWHNRMRKILLQLLN